MTVKKTNLTIEINIENHQIATSLHHQIAQSSHLLPLSGGRHRGGLIVEFHPDRIIGVEPKKATCFAVVHGDLEVAIASKEGKDLSYRHI